MMITHTPERGGTRGQDSQTCCVFLAVATKNVFQDEDRLAQMFQESCLGLVALDSDSLVAGRGCGSQALL